MSPTFKVWQLDISEDDFNTGVEYVALVDDPAILRMWQAFGAQKVAYKIASQDRHIVMGPLMIPNMPIFRTDEVHGEHYVMYSKESIEKIVRKFFRQKNTGNVNLMHLPAATTNEIYMIESFIIDSSRGIAAPQGFDNLPDGTWFGSYQITSDAIWKAVQDGTFRGFSVEGYFGYSNPEDMPQTRIENLISAVQNGTPEEIKYLSSKTNNMGVLSKILSPEKQVALQKLLFGDGVTPPVTTPAPAPVDQVDATKALTKSGDQLYAEGGFVQGSKIFIVTPEGQVPAPDGKYELDNGIVCEVTGGTIMNVTEGTTEAAAPAPDPNAQYKALEEKFTAFVNETKTALAEVQQTCLLMAEKFTASETSFTQIRTDLSNVQEATKLIHEVLTKLEGTPEHADVSKPAQDIFKSEVQKDEDRIKSLSASIKRIKTA